MNYAKPRPSDYRRPDDANEILNEIEDGDSNEGELIIDGGCTVGFFDETFPKSEDVYQRVCDFEIPSQEVLTERFDANAFGFSALNGVDAVELMPNSKSESVYEFLRQIREKNPDGPLIVILDNYPSHYAHDVTDFAEELQIQFVFLPTYSPHLNSTEPLWRELNYVLSRVFVIMVSTRSENWLRIRGVEVCFCLFTDPMESVSRDLYAFPQIHRIDACINLFYTI